MKLNSKSGATLAAAAATLFLAGASMTTAAYAADTGHCVGANACKGAERLQGRQSRLQGAECLQGPGLSRN